MEKLNIDHYTVWFQNREETLQLKQEIFTHHEYYFETENPRPVIIDAGAHIGLSTLYFKKLYPDALIYALEPHPISFSLLQRNISENHLTNVKLLPVGLAETESQRPLFADTEFGWHSTASFIPGAWNKTQKTVDLPVTTTTLAQLVHQPIDLLKLDIEGWESTVLMTTPSATLKQIKHIIAEIHPHEHLSLEKLIRFLEDEGFSVSTTENPRNYSGKNASLQMLEATR